MLKSGHSSRGSPGGPTSRRKGSGRPHGWVLRHLLKQGEAQDVLDAARRAGRELVTLEECMRMQNE
ncbi:MAG: hypothetical protein KAW84_00285 [Thermoplasmata archaeon]|nr:hypothetical protein [Thermoplasmata archaeon]